MNKSTSIGLSAIALVIIVGGWYLFSTSNTVVPTASIIPTEKQVVATKQIPANAPTPALITTTTDVPSKVNGTTPTVTTFATLSTPPATMAFDINGNLYVTGSGLYQIDKPLTKISPSGIVATIATIPAGIDALVFDKSDNLYGINSISDTIVKITSQGGITSFAKVGSQSRTIGFDTAGNLYTANLNGDTFREGPNTNTISKITPSGTVTTAPTVDFENARGSGSENALSFPFALTFDTSGSFYAALGDKSIVKVALSGATTTFATLKSVSSALAFDKSGNLYALGEKSISKITPAGTVTTVANVSPNIHVLAFDALDNLYFADYDSNRKSTIISKITLTK